MFTSIETPSRPFCRRLLKALVVLLASVGSHSFRFGGASALRAAFHVTGLVRRSGSWASDSLQTYISENRKGSTGIAAAMAVSDITTA